MNSRSRTSLLLLAVLPAVAQAQSPPGVNLPGQLQTPGAVSTVPQAPGITPPVGAVGVGGTTTQVMPNLPSASGGVSVPGSTGVSNFGGLPGAAGSTSATAPNMPGYAAPGTAPLPGYSVAPGSTGFPPVGSVPSPGTPLSPVSPLDNSGMGMSGSSTGSGVLGGSSGYSSGTGTGGAGGLSR